MSAWPAEPGALEHGRKFLSEPRTRWLLAPDGDVDGLCSGMLIHRTLQRLSAQNVLLTELARKGENLNSASYLQRMAACLPDALIVSDQGSRPEPLLSHTPTLIVDHHHPQGFAEGVVVVSAFGCEPVAASSLLAFELCRTLVPLDDLRWLAMLGTAADLSLDAPFPELWSDLETWGRKNITEAIALLNAPRRSASWDARLSWDVLSRASSPADIARGLIPGVDTLRLARTEVNAEIAVCSKAAPKFSGQVAIISLESTARVHGLMAARWSNRLPKYIALAANWGYLPGRVNFSMRTKNGTNLIAFLRSLNLDLGAEFANGHPQATGGSVTQENFIRLLKALGFPEDLRPSR